MRMTALRIALLFAAALAMPWSGVAQAQTTVTSGLQVDTTLPIAVDADQLSVDQTSGVAVFSGDVRITQGTFTVTAPKATLSYNEDRTEIGEVRLEGGVTMTNGAEVVQGQTAIYDVPKGVVVVTGDVVVTQGASTIAGPKLTYDLEKGTGVMDGGRVQSVFTPGSGSAAGTDKKE